MKMELDKKYTASEVDYAWIETNISESIAWEVQSFLQSDNPDRLSEPVLKISHDYYKSWNTNEAIVDYYFLFMLDADIYTMVRYDARTGSTINLPFNKFDLRAIHAL